MHRTLLWFVGALTVVASFAPVASAMTAADAWWSTDSSCDPATNALRGSGVTHDNNSTGDSRIEYDPVKGHDCAELRDDLQRAVYENVGSVSGWGCSSYFTPWTTCVGINQEGCDLWLSWMAWQCIGGLFPDNTPA